MMNLKMYAELLNSTSKGIIVCGQIDDKDFAKQVVATMQINYNFQY